MQYHKLSSSSSPSSSSFLSGKSYQLVLLVICAAPTSQSVTSTLPGSPSLFTMCLHFTPPASLPGAWVMMPMGWRTSRASMGPLGDQGTRSKASWPILGPWIWAMIATLSWNSCAISCSFLSRCRVLSRDGCSSILDGLNPSTSQTSICQTLLSHLMASAPEMGLTLQTLTVSGKEQWVLSGSLALSWYLHLKIRVSSFHRDNCWEYLFIDYSLIYLTFLVIISCYTYLYHFALVVSVISSKAASNTLMFLWKE